MEILLIYLYTMIVTTIIALYDGQNQIGCIYVSKFIKIILFLPVKKNKKAPIYLIVIHCIIQVITIICLRYIYVYGAEKYTYIQRLYGSILVGGCMLITIIMKRLMKK